MNTTRSITEITAANKTLFLQNATNIGIQLCREAIWSKNRCNWLTITHESNSSNTYLRAMYNEFYIGTSGVAFFLTALYRANPDPLFKKTAEGAIRQALSQVEQTDIENRMGFYRGWTGIAYTALYAGKHLENPAFLKQGKALVKRICRLDPATLKLDIVEGIASGLPVLVKIYRQFPNQQLKKKLYELGDFLIDSARKTAQGWSWETVKLSKHLTGFAHGASGFLYALLELYHLEKQEQYLKAAQQVLAFENSHYRSEEQNWPDFRSNGQVLPEDHHYPCVSAWCHGAPGIGLARVRAYEITGDAVWKKDADIAIATTVKNTVVSNNYNQSLCHGVFGNAEVLINASLAFADEKLWQEAVRYGEDCIASFPQQGRPWLNGIGTAHQIPGFMLGISGMGYYLLRLCDPIAFESMLLISGE